MRQQLAHAEDGESSDRCDRSYASADSSLKCGADFLVRVLNILAQVLNAVEKLFV